MTTIEIDFDVRKAIEANRDSFAETPNDVLKRMVGLGAPALKLVPAGKPYTYQHLELPHGTEARMTYNNVDYRATPGSPDFIFLNDLWKVSQKRQA